MENKNLFIRISITENGYDFLLSRELRDYIRNTDYDDVRFLTDMISDILYDYWCRTVPDQIGDDYDG